MPKSKALEREPSRGNVFADLGLPDAGEHLIQAGLVVRIGRIIQERKLTQAGAAELLGIDQPKISAMLAGRFRGYSVERLMRFLVALGQDVEIVEARYGRTARCIEQANENSAGRNLKDWLPRAKALGVSAIRSGRSTRGPTGPSARSIEKIGGVDALWEPAMLPSVVGVSDFPNRKAVFL